MQHRGHPPRKALYLPHAAQTRFGIVVQAIGRTCFVEIDQRSRQNAYVGYGKIQSFRTGGRNDVRSVTEKKQIAVAHRLGYEAAHRADALLQDWTVGELPSVAGSHSR